MVSFKSILTVAAFLAAGTSAAPTGLDKREDQILVSRQEICNYNPSNKQCYGLFKRDEQVLVSRQEICNYNPSNKQCYGLFKRNGCYRISANKPCVELD
ncbi:hypothetical protein HDU97_006629 [Phlyctochytrium planicorne]|nr:hypothetical protein HDU97_006629 [Phlyctochytrium planicorne]